MTKKTTIKTLLTAGLAALLGTALGSSAHADSLPPETGDLVIHKYIGAAVGPAHDGTELTVAPSDVIPANGVVFDLFRVGPAIAAEADNAPWPDVPPVGAYVRNATTGHLEVYAGKTLIGEYGLTVAAPAHVTTANNGTGTAAGLPRGTYLVIENAVASTKITDATTGAPLFVSQTVAPFLVAVPMTNPTGDGWLDVVHVYPKNELLSVEKEVESPGGVVVGDTVTYTITVSVPGDIAESKVFNIYDKLDGALDLDIESVTVSTVPALAGLNTLVLGTDYAVTWHGGSRIVLVGFTDSGRAKLAGLSSVVVEFDTTVNAEILKAKNRIVDNIGQVDFTNADGVDYHSESEGGGDGDSQIHTAAIQITKVDQHGLPLSGARFKIASSQANALAGNFLRLDPYTLEVYDIDDSPMSRWAAHGPQHDWEITPDHVGSFGGLRDFVEVDGQIEWQTYWIVETAAPQGYNLLSEPLPVSFEEAAANDAADYQHLFTLTVHNSQGFVLPETGGLGRLAWTVAGVALMGLAGLLILTRRRRDEADRS